MRVSGIHVTGFGRIDGTELSGLDHPLVVIEGPNGSGKTSLMEFVTGVLTGFPRGNTRRRKYPPAGTTRHGGSLLVNVDSRPVVISRHLPENEPEITGDPRAVEEVARALAGLSASFYRGLLAFDVDALNRLELMSDREINDLVYGAGSSGSGVSPRRAMELLRARASEVYLPRGRRPVLNQRIEELDSARAELRRCLDRVGDTTRLRSGIGTLQAELDSLKTSRTQLHHELWRLETALSLWTGHVRAGRHRDALARIHAKVPGDVLLRVEERRSSIDTVLAEIPSPAGTDGRVAEITSRLVRLQAQAAEAQGLLGEEWTVERIRSTLVPVAEAAEGEARWAMVTAAATELERFRERGSVARSRLAGAEATLRQVRLEASSRGWDPRSDPRVLRQKAMAVRAAGDELTNIERVLASGRSTRSGDAPSTPAGRLRYAAATAVAAAGSLGGGWMIASGQPGPALGLLALTVLLALLLGPLSRPPAAGLGSDQAPLRERHHEITSGLLTDARWLGFEPPSDPEEGASSPEALTTLPVAAMVAHADRMETTATAVTVAAGEVAEARARVESADREEAMALSRHRRALDEWRAWAHRLGLPADLSGPTLTTLLTRLTEARRLDLEAEAVRGELEALRQRRDALTAKLADLHRELSTGATSVVAHPPGELIRELEELLRLSKEARDLTSRLDEWDQRVREQAGERLTEVIATLGENDPGRWRERRETVAVDIAEVEDEIERLVGELRSTRDELDRLESSAEVAEKTQKVATLEDTALELWNGYRALRAAAELVEQTLRQHEARRQPEVVRSASEIFSRVTDGTYTDLIVTEGSVHVIDGTGAKVSPSALSRGTVEQLYMSLRLALIETFSRRHPVPVVLDEVLVDFDPQRTAAMVGEIVHLSEVTQVIVFTCHPSTADELQRLAPGVRRLKLGDPDRRRAQSPSSSPPSPPSPPSTS